LKRGKKKLASREVTLQAIWPIAEVLTKVGWPKTLSGIHGPLGPIFFPIDKVNITADCWENQFRLLWLWP
jgi:hypothetical protein